MVNSPRAWHHFSFASATVSQHFFRVELRSKRRILMEIGMRIFRFLIAFAFLAGLAASAGFAQQQSTFHIARTVNLGGDGSWDYLTYDREAQRLFIARSTRVMVVDVNAGKLNGEIPNTDGVHGVALVTGLRRGVTSNGKANTATIFDLDTLKPLATAPTGEKPDGILWEPVAKAVFTMNGHSNSITLIDPQAGKPLGSIPLPGRPETAVSDQKGKVYVNLEDKARIAVVDVATRIVEHTWDLAGCTEPTGLAIDLEHRRLFSGCHSGVLVVVDADTGKNVQKLPIGNGVDAVAFDPEIRTIFTSNGEGSISVIKQLSADSYRNQETVSTLPGAKTMALDPVRHVVYTVANREGQFVMLEVKRQSGEGTAGAGGR
jgi:DNA-binding beta-propeller fold protein YncE